MKNEMLKMKNILSVLVFLLTCGVSNSYSQTAFMADRGVAVFYPADFDSAHNLPSFALVRDLKPQKAVPANWEVRPDFQIMNGKQVVRFTLKGKVDFYGNGEVTGELRRNNTSVTLWNTDNFTYSKDQGKRLYHSHPWILGVRPNGTSFGILADNTWKQSFDLSNSVTITSEGPAFRVIVIEKNSPQEVLETLASLTGKMELPPIWALGFQQCRYSYFPESRVREVASEFRKRHLPCDVIWMDIDYMQNYKIFTFDSLAFRSPKKLNTYLHSIDFKTIWMIDPGVKKEPGYFVYDQGTAGNHWVMNRSKQVFNGNVWPGECVFPDFTRPETRSWWGSLYKNYMPLGIDGVWNDMNEPSVFNEASGSMPEDNFHRGGGDLPADSHLRYHDVYGMLMARSSREGILKVNPDKRPFLLTRSNYLGGQRYAAIWTGDNISTWEHFKMATPMVLNLGLSGQPFSGPDIGGYKGSPDTLLFANWMTVGVFYPFCRNHTAKNTANQELWAFGKKVEDISRIALERRCRLLPYLYTLFHETSVTGLPVMRPVFFADVADTTLRREQQAFT
jgi:alpha-glucosidase